MLYNSTTSYPETAKPLLGLAEELLRGPSSLTSAERELIATYVSAQNDCTFCMNSHAAIARSLYGKDRELVDQTISDFQLSDLSDKMKALLVIAGQVQQRWPARYGRRCRSRPRGRC